VIRAKKRLGQHFLADENILGVIGRLAELGPEGQKKTFRGNVTNQERRISLDHSFEKAQGDNYLLALEGDNLELMFQNANSYREIVQMRHGMRD